MSGTLPDDLRPTLDNGIPPVIVSCSSNGVPNTSYLSKVYWVDERHVALSFQFFNKTRRNVQENPNVAVMLYDPERAATWRLQLRFDHAETEGGIFDELDMQIEAIASMTGMTGIFKLKAADVYEVKSCEKIPSPNAPGT